MGRLADRVFKRFSKTKCLDLRCKIQINYFLFKRQVLEENTIQKFGFYYIFYGSTYHSEILLQAVFILQTLS